MDRLIGGGFSLRIVLVEIKGHGHIFLAEPPAMESEDTPSTGTVQGWFARKRIALLAEMHQAKGFLGRTIGKVWIRLQRLVSPDEYLLRGLRRADSVFLDYPAGLAADQVVADWKDYLARRVAKHRNWLIVDAILAAPALLLSPVPGPNILCYWLSYRCLIHFLARRGAVRGRNGSILTTLQPRTELDTIVSPDDDEQIARIAAALEFPDFGVLLLLMTPQAIESHPEISSS